MINNALFIIMNCCLFNQRCLITLYILSSELLMIIASIAVKTNIKLRSNGFNQPRLTLTSESFLWFLVNSPRILFGNIWFCFCLLLALKPTPSIFTALPAAAHLSRYLHTSRDVTACGVSCHCGDVMFQTDWVTDWDFSNYLDLI